MSYLDYFDPESNIRYIKRYVTDPPEGNKEFPNTTYSSYITWLISKFIKKDASKKDNVKTAESNATTPSLNGGKRVVNLYNSAPNTSDTIRTRDRVIIFNNQLLS